MASSALQPLKITPNSQPSSQDLNSPALRSAGFASIIPISFDRALFSGESFSPQEFIADRRHIALDRLKSELQQGLRDLKTELVELINLDYADFINLSTRLVGVDRMIGDLARPLEQIQNVVQSVRDALADVVTQLEDDLEKRAVIREKKVYIQLFVSIHDSIEKLDALLHESKAETKFNEQGEESVRGGKLIERVANEYSQLRYLISRANGTPFVKKIEKRINRIKSTLTSSLSRSLTAAYKDVMADSSSAATDAALSQILRTYVSVDRVDDAEKIFEQSITSPFLEQVVTRQKVEPPGNSAAPRSAESRAHSPLQNMYDAIVRFVRTDCAKALEVSGKAFHGTEGDLLVHAIWAPVAATIIKACPFIFNPGIPEVFHENYAMTMDFMTKLETQCRSKGGLNTFRSHSATVDFLKRWQLPVYFQIRFREIATDFEETAVSTYDYERSMTTSEGLILPPSSALIICINLCWDDSVYLRGLTHRFWKLTLQLLARYIAWVRDALHPDIIVAGGNALPEPSQPAAVSSQNGPSSPERPLPPLPDTAGDERVLQKFLYFHQDLTSLADQVTIIFNAEIRSKLPSAVRDASILRDCIHDALSPLQTFLPPLANRVCSVLAKRCADRLKNDGVSSIPSQYRMTNKEPPTRPSYFVPTIFAPLRAFLEAHSPPSKDAPMSKLQREWTAVVTGEVAQTYAVVATDVMAEVKRFEDFRLKAKQRRPVGGANVGTGGAGAMSDHDKIRLQMFLDVKQFGEDVEALVGRDRASSLCKDVRALVEPYRELVGRP
ncbi:Conserved oligomeric Golgi complex subunit 2 [Thoreauomyces humboldtii]|nr:Conserved oligomeric Golgi complex subunit 2 [Thoreauomyces humboldtii]